MKLSEAKQILNKSGYILKERMTRYEFNNKFEEVTRMYAEATDDERDLDDIKDELMDNDELPEWIESDLSAYDIVYDKLLGNN